MQTNEAIDLTIPGFLRRSAAGSMRHTAAIAEPPPKAKPLKTKTLEQAGMQFVHVLWTMGDLRTVQENAEHFNEVRDPPCNGWQHALLIRGDKLHTIFCPYYMLAFQVSPESFEMAHLRDQPLAWRPDFVVPMMLRKWNDHVAWGMPIDFDVAALVLQRLGVPVPAMPEPAEGEEPRQQSGGKVAGDELLKPVPRDGKRGRVLAWFQEKEGRSIREAMVVFESTRSNLLSHLFDLNRHHGLGYSITGDAVRVALPDGCADPFAEDE